MRSVLSATLLVVAFNSGLLESSAEAQMTPPSTAGAKPKVVTTVPVRPAMQKPEETANAMAQAERLALQSDLAWVGQYQYNGAITGDISERMVAAIKEFQKCHGGGPTGVLNPQERGVLADTARRKQEFVGWKIVTGTIQIQLARRKEASPTTAKLAEREKKEPAGRNIDYTVVKPDFFVLSGLQGLKKFYVRGTFKGDEVRIFTILYDQATENPSNLS
jgi:peptidoglycan hydrolase-like protein with peptidoglycan-binding domain